MPASDPTPSRFFNRELSWLEFNQRVLEHAESAEQPLLERTKFLAITGSNLDEFFMVRVGGLKLQHERNPMVRDPAGLTIGEQLHAVSERCHHLQGHQYRILREGLEPALADSGVRRIQLETAGQRARAAADEWFQKEVLAVLSPQSLYYDLPFPMLQGLQLHLCVRLEELPEPAPISVAAAAKESSPATAGEDAQGQLRGSDVGGAPDLAGVPAQPLGWQFAVIPLGRVINRLITLPTEKGYGFVLLEDLVKEHIDEFFPGRKVLDCTTFRITRNADVQLREDAAPDLMIGMEEVLESRRQSRCVRLEISSDASSETVAYLTETLGVTSQDLFLVDGPLDLTYLFQLVSLEGFRSLRSEPWPPQGSPAIEPAESMFSNIARGDCMLIHPYERFDPVLRLIEEAAIDPDVLAIKQILYRTSRDSPIVEALKRAAEHGKYVTAIVELKARFDEARNIEWAREMERAGVQVIYGVRGLKTHAKVCIIVRREPHGIVRYMHFGTGNYNEVTASIYSDVSLLTSNEAIGEDATKFFNSVTGASQPNAMQHLAAAPTTMRSRLLGLIEAETLRRRQGQEAEIIAKVNAIVDTDIINALYEASQAGVRIRLNVRGVCCLVPGVKGLSKTIEVVSIVDRFLEHARVVYFKHGGDEQLFISSADWMPRNLDRRVELLVPILRPELRKRLLTTLQTYFKDNTNAWRLLPSGRYERLTPSDKKPAVRSQAVLYNRAVAAKRRAEQSGRTTFETHQPRQAD
ncbi:MAG: polyphosphate kinase 1 [Planctomycetaceae bacterium]